MKLVELHTIVEKYILDNAPMDNKENIVDILGFILDMISNGIALDTYAVSIELLCNNNKIDYVNLYTFLQTKSVDKEMLAEFYPFPF